MMFGRIQRPVLWVKGWVSCGLCFGFEIVEKDICSWLGVAELISSTVVLILLQSLALGLAVDPELVLPRMPVVCWMTTMATKRTWRR